MSDYHISVLLQEVVQQLHVQKGKKYIDATLGGGGHTKEILARGGIVLGIDCDQEAIDVVSKEIPSSDHFTAIRGNFKDMKALALSHHFSSVAGILFDFGVSSHQLATGYRGFSFMHDAPLDMRMDDSLAVRACDLINGLTKKELLHIFTTFGQEARSYAIVMNILKAREIKPIQTTKELAEIVEKVYAGVRTEIHPATKIFQALRIIVNSELESISQALPAALALLEDKGRIVTISFHSLEDRIVKQQFKQWEEEKNGKMITEKPIEPGEEEKNNNKKSRSAKLRVFEKMN